MQLYHSKYLSEKICSKIKSVAAYVRFRSRKREMMYGFEGFAEYLRLSARYKGRALVTVGETCPFGCRAQGDAVGAWSEEPVGLARAISLTLLCPQEIVHDLHKPLKCIAMNIVGGSIKLDSAT